MTDDVQTAEEAVAAELEASQSAPAPVETKQTTMSATEEKARAGGWVDVDEWVAQGNDAADHRSAREFNDRGELFRKISNQSKELKKYREGIKELTEHNRRVAEYEREKILGELKAAKIEALGAEDHARVVEIDDQIAEVKASPIPAATVEDDVDPALSEAQEIAAEWVGRNQWYENDPVLRKEADMAIHGYKAVHPNASVSELFENAAKQVRRMNPEKFKSQDNGTPKVAGGQTGGGSGSGGKSMPTLADLDYETQKTVRNMCEITDLKPEQYIKELVQTGAIQWDQ